MSRTKKIDGKYRGNLLARGLLMYKMVVVGKGTFGGVVQNIKINELSF